MNSDVVDPMLEIEDLVHCYGPVRALSHVSVSAAKGEFLTILGSSGSGKTTMLRVISGLEMPTSVKRLRIGGQDVARLPAAKRNCTTVFQSYALFPHMNVVENVAYGLKIRKVNAADALKEARDRLANSPMPPGFDTLDRSQVSVPPSLPQNLDVVDGLIACFGQPYQEAYGSAHCRDVGKQEARRKY